MRLVKGFAKTCNAFLKNIQGILYELPPVNQSYVAIAMRSILYFKCGGQVISDTSIGFVSAIFRS
jgi:hypothetical protein